MGVEVINITANPVTLWEQFHMSLPRQALADDPLIDKRDMGGYYSMDFVLHEDRATRAVAVEFLMNGIGRHVVAMGSRSIPVFEGLVGKITMDTGSAVLINDVTHVANRQWARYLDTTVKRSTVIEHAESQNRIGIKEMVAVVGDVDLGVADQAINAVIKWNGFPHPTVRSLTIGGEVRENPRLSITVLGYWHTLAWRIYNQTILTGNADMTTIAAAIITAVGDYAKSVYIEDNLTPIDREFDSDRTAQDLIRSMAGMSDGGFRKWIAGFRNDREFYLMQAQRPDYI